MLSFFSSFNYLQVKYSAFCRLFLVSPRRKLSVRGLLLTFLYIRAREGLSQTVVLLDESERFEVAVDTVDVHLRILVAVVGGLAEVFQ